MESVLILPLMFLDFKNSSHWRVHFLPWKFQISKNKDLTLVVTTFQWELWEHMAPQFKNQTLHTSKRNEVLKPIYIYKHIVTCYAVDRCSRFVDYYSRFRSVSESCSLALGEKLKKGAFCVTTILWRLGGVCKKFLSNCY